MDSRESGTWHGLAASRFAELADEFGTPFYLFDADAVAARIQYVRESFGSNVKVYYAVKANPNLELLRAVRDAADGLDISSSGELDQALLAGFASDALSFAGPAKTTEELTAAVTKGVGAISVESMRELAMCAEIARRHSTAAQVLLRINPLLQNRSFGMKMAGRPIQFGIDEECLEPALSMLAREAEHVRFRGIHVYAGSQGFEVDGLAEGIENTLRIAENIESATGLACRKINLGGGFGVAHGGAERELDVAALGRRLGPRIREMTADSRREIVIELGRYLTAEAGIYVARVISEKQSRGKLFFAADGGLHHHLAAAGTFGAALRSNFVLRNLSRPSAAPARCNIAGPSCNPTDLLGVDVEFAAPQVGDLIGVERSGSYGLSASPLLFLGRKTPAELVMRDGAVTLGRRVRTILDFN
jgi:diaminopimelate decarboxylase